MWAGGMMFPRIVVQEEALWILEDFGIRHGIPARILCGKFN